jgi:hypothetical protein
LFYSFVRVRIKVQEVNSISQKYSSEILVYIGNRDVKEEINHGVDINFSSALYGI